MGRVVELKGRNGEYIPSFISIDKLTNEGGRHACRECLSSPTKSRACSSPTRRQNDLREGKKVYVEGMIAKSGNEFNAHIQVNADVEVSTSSSRTTASSTVPALGGVELTKQQIEDLNAGKAIFVEGYAA